MHHEDSATDPPEYFATQKMSETNGTYPGLSFRVLGVYVEGGLRQASCAFLQYYQDDCDGPLRVEIIEHDEIVIPAEQRLQLITILRDAQLRAVSISRFNILLGLMFTDRIKEFCNQRNIPLTSIDFVSTRSLASPTGPRNASHNVSIDTLFGWNTVVAKETGISTVFDFVIAENTTIKAQSLHTAFAEQLFLRHATKFRACLNIGELVTINFIPSLEDGSTRGTLARHCGPGSLLIDYAVRYVTSNFRGDDNDGKRGELGHVKQNIVDRFLSTHDYSRTQPSLVMAREMFGTHEAQQLVDECLLANLPEADTVATITRVTARNILLQFRRLLALFFPHGQKVDELFICGPLARSASIIDYLQLRLPRSIIMRHLEDIGILGDANEAVAVAHLAFEAVLNQGSRCIPASPHATKIVGTDTVRGKTIPGHHWASVLEDIQRFSKGKPLYVNPEVNFKKKPDTASSI